MTFLSVTINRSQLWSHVNVLHIQGRRKGRERGKERREGKGKKRTKGGGKERREKRNKN